MTNKYRDENTSIILAKVASATPKELEDMIKWSCVLGSESWVKNLIQLVGAIKYQYALEADPQIIKSVVDSGYYEIVQYIMLETNLKREAITRSFLNDVCPPEIVKILDFVEYKKKLLGSVIADDLKSLDYMFNNGFDEYPYPHSLIKKVLLQFFTTNKTSVEMFKYILNSDKTKSFYNEFLNESLNLAMFSDREDVLKYLILELKITRTSSVELLLSLDKSMIATKMFNSRDLKNELSDILSKKDSGEGSRSGTTKI